MANNMVLMGALIESGMLPMTPDQVREAIRTTTKPAFVATNLKAFASQRGCAETCRVS